MTRSPFLYLAFPPLIIIVILLVPVLINLIPCSKKESHPTNFLNALLIGLGTIITIGSFYIGARHYLPSIISIISLVGLFALIGKKTSFGWREILFSALLILAGSLYINMFMYTLDYGGKTPTSHYEDKVDYSKEIGDKAFPFYEADYLLPINSASRYISEDWNYFSGKLVGIYNVTDRAPFMYFLLIPVLKLFGWNFFVYQITLAVLSSLYLIPLYYLAKHLLKNTKLAFLATLLGVFSHFFLFTALFGPSKNFTLFFILASLLYLFEFFQTKDQKSLALSGLVFGMAYMSHQFSFLYLIASVILIIYRFGWKKVLKKENIKLLTYFLSPVVVILIMWKFYVLSTGLKNTVYNNVMFHIQWGDVGKSMNAGGEVDVSGMVSILFDWRFWANKLANFLGYFIFKLGPFKKHFDFMKVTLPGALNIVVCMYLLLFITKKFIRENKDIFVLIALSLILPVIYNGFYIPMGLMWYALGCVPLFYILFAKALDTSLGKKIGGKVMMLALVNSLVFSYWDSERTKIQFRFLNLFRNGNYPMMLVLAFVFGYIILVSYLMKSGRREKDENIG